MDINEIVKAITMCAKTYSTNLLNKNLLMIYGKETKPSFFEAEFKDINFLHLTGVELNNIKETSKTDFYKKCLRGQLSPTDIIISNNSTVAMKMQVLPQLMSIHKKAKMIGDYNFSKTLLYSEKIIGNVVASLGFILSENGYYYPNTTLKEDVRKITNRPQERVLAVFRKNIKDERYSELCYISSGVKLEQICLDKHISNKLSALPTSQKEPLNMKTQEKTNMTTPIEETPAYAKTVEKYGKATADRLKNEILEPKQESPKQGCATRGKAKTK